MADEETKDIEAKVGTWLLGATGSAWLAVAAPLGTAIAALLSAHLAKRDLLLLLGAQALSMLLLLWLFRRAFSRRGIALAQAQADLATAIAEQKKEKSVFDRLEPVAGYGYSIDPKNNEAVCPSCVANSKVSYMKRVGQNLYCYVCHTSVQGCFPIKFGGGR